MFPAHPIHPYLYRMVCATSWNKYPGSVMIANPKDGQRIDAMFCTTSIVYNVLHFSGYAVMQSQLKFKLKHA